MGNLFKTAVLLAALTCLVVLIGGAIGGQQGMLIAFVVAAGMNFASYWFSDRIVLSMYHAQPVDEASAPDLFTMVRRLATRAGLPMTRVYIIPGDTPNAFATGRNPEHAAVAVTEGIMRMLDDDELEGVLAHELSHVQNRDTLIMTIAATLAGVACMGAIVDAISSFSSALASPHGRPARRAPLASAWNSRVREMAIWTSMAAIGARKAMAIPAITPP